MDINYEQEEEKYFKDMKEKFILKMPVRMDLNLDMKENSLDVDEPEIKKKPKRKINLHKEKNSDFPSL